MITPSLRARPFCLIRHGETTANRDKLIAGNLDVALTNTGIAQAKSLRQYMWPTHLTLYSSPLSRAEQTARVGFGSFEPRFDPRLQERNWGDLEGQDISKLPPRHLTPPGGEPWNKMISRVVAALGEILDNVAEHPPVIVAHSGTIRVVRNMIGGECDGPSPLNATPLLYLPKNGNWQEIRLDPSTSIQALISQAI